MKHRVKTPSFHGATVAKCRHPANPWAMQFQKAISQFKMLQSRQRGGF
jgi:hypothetical protein